MPAPSIDRSRQFVHQNGTMWERALWDQLFDGGSLERVHQCWLCYENPDGTGWSMTSNVHRPMRPHSNFS